MAIEPDVILERISEIEWWLRADQVLLTVATVAWLVGVGWTVLDIWRGRRG